MKRIANTERVPNILKRIEALAEHGASFGNVPKSTRDLSEVKVGIPYTNTMAEALPDRQRLLMQFPGGDRIARILDRVAQIG